MADKTQEEAKVSKKVEELVEEISKLSVMELSKLVTALQDKLGITPQVATVAAPGEQVVSPEQSATSAPAASAGQATQTVVMTASGENKIAVIKALREINQNLGLKEAKDATENLPFEVLKDVKPEEAKSAADKLKAAGATVEVK